MELVAERKHRIQAKAATAEYFDLSEALSSKLELDQTQLASWDASARSWIRAANDSPAVSERQKTVRSILDHINTNVRSQQDLYTSVTEAWKLSLETMEKIITGSSYSIEDGSVVISLLSWHLYPDLIVLGSRTKDIFQNDELVEPGGCVTVGLKSHRLSLDDESGVHWSLSLAHLRYYGVTKPTSRYLSNTPSGNERFTAKEFTLIMLGVIIARWRDEEAVSVEDAISFIRVFISTFIDLFQAENPEQLGSWKTELVAAMDECNASDSHIKGLARKFVNIGLRNKSIFSSNLYMTRTSITTGSLRTYSSLMGLNSLNFVKVLADKEDQERFLIASMRRLIGSSAEGSRPVRKLMILVERETTNDFRKLLIFTKSSLKGLETAHSSSDSLHKSEDGSHYIAHVKDGFTYAKNEKSYLWSSPPKPVQRYLRRNYPRKNNTMQANESTPSRFGEVVTTTYFVVLETRQEQRESVFSDLALQRRQEIQDYLLHAKLAKYEFLHLVGNQPISRVLLLLSATCDFYANLPGSTISPNILNCRLMPLANSLYEQFNRPHLFWEELRPQLTPKHVATLLQERVLSQKPGAHLAFMLLVTFEAGVDVPSNLSSICNWHQLIAVSTDDSIYINPIFLGSVASRTTSPLELRRVRGNVGRPGVSLIGWFGSSSQSEWRQPRRDMWHVVNHNPFQGKPEDAFGGTSLHLNVTGWAREVDFGGNKRVADGAFMEAVVSAHDTGTWLGDLSFPLLRNQHLCIIREKKDCRKDTPVIGTMPPEDLVLVENWEELLTPHPVQPAVVMCHGNWQARITAVSLCLSKGYRTLLFDGHGCWQCAFTHLEELKLKVAQARRRRTVLEDDESYSMSSDDDTSSVEDSEEDEENNAKARSSSPDPATLDKESQQGLEKGDDEATLVDQDKSGNNTDELAIGINNAFDQAYDSDASITSSSSSSDSEDDDESDRDRESNKKLKREVKEIPYVTTVFIL